MAITSANQSKYVQQHQPSWQYHQPKTKQTPVAHILVQLLINVVIPTTIKYGYNISPTRQNISLMVKTSPSILKQ